MEMFCRQIQIKLKVSYVCKSKLAFKCLNPNAFNGLLQIFGPFVWKHLTRGKNGGRKICLLTLISGICPTFSFLTFAPQNSINFDKVISFSTPLFPVVRSKRLRLLKLWHFLFWKEKLFSYGLTIRKH